MPIKGVFHISGFPILTIHTYGSETSRGTELSAESLARLVSPVKTAKLRKISLIILAEIEYFGKLNILIRLVPEMNKNNVCRK